MHVLFRKKKKTKGFLIEAISAFMGQKRMRDKDRRGASGTVVKEGECRGRCEGEMEERRDRGTKKTLKMGDGEGWMLEQSMEGEQWPGEKHLRDGGRETRVKKDSRIWVMKKGRHNRYVWEGGEIDEVVNTGGKHGGREGDGERCTAVLLCSSVYVSMCIINNCANICLITTS